MMERRVPRAALGIPEWLGLGALAFGSLYILMDFSVGLFPMQGAVSPVVGAALVLTSLDPDLVGGLDRGRGAGTGRRDRQPGRVGARLDAVDQRLLDRFLPAAVPNGRAAGGRGAPREPGVRASNPGRRAAGALTAPSEGGLARPKQ